MIDGNDERASQQRDNEVQDKPIIHEEPVHIVPRRQMLGVSAAVGVGLGLNGLGVEAAKSPARMRPQPGDLVVFRFGDRAGQPVSPADVPEGAELLQAVSKDPDSGAVRDGSRLNGVNLVRVDAADFDAETKGYAAEGVIAYSSVCTHQGCDLTQWLPDTTTFKCYCHYSQFNAAKMGEPSFGPAKRKLAVLPMKVNGDGYFEVAEKFVGKVGFKR